MPLLSYKEVLEGGEECLAVFGCADVIELKREAVVDPEILEDLCTDVNELRIETGIFEPDQLQIHLMEWPVPSFLWTIIPEALTDRVELYWLRQLLHAVFDVASADAGSEFRTKRVLNAAFAFLCSRLLSGNHKELLLHDIRVLADATFEDRTVLEDWRVDAFVSRLTCAVAHGLLDVRHVLMIFGEDIVRAFRCSEERFCHDLCRD